MFNWIQNPCTSLEGFIKFVFVNEQKGRAGVFQYNFTYYGWLTKVVLNVLPPVRYNFKSCKFWVICQNCLLLISVPGVTAVPDTSRGAVPSPGVPDPAEHQGQDKGWDRYLLPPTGRKGGLQTWGHWTTAPPCSPPKRPPPTGMQTAKWCLRSMTPKSWGIKESRSGVLLGGQEANKKFRDCWKEEYEEIGNKPNVHQQENE